MQKEIRKLEVICFYLYIIWVSCWLGYYIGNKKDNVIVGIRIGVFISFLSCLIIYLTVFNNIIIK